MKIPVSQLDHQKKFSLIYNHFGTIYTKDICESQLVFFCEMRKLLNMATFFAISRKNFE